MVKKIESKKCNSVLIYDILHQAVMKPNNNTTKLRIVYDASAKRKNESKSLNEYTYQTPVVLKDLWNLLLWFQTNKIVVVKDIEKAFLQTS